nr:MAG TPA: hypothetical protein [Caudoviricetes sp.]
MKLQKILELAGLLCACMNQEREFREIPLKRALPNIIKEAYHLFFLTKKNTKCVH